MKLSDEDQERLDNLNRATRLTCRECLQLLTKRYCGICDEFFGAGHKLKCSERLDRGVDHTLCRRP